VNKKIFIILPVILTVLLAIVLIRLFSGEDNWICQNNEWVKHGYPSAPKPTKPCKETKQTETIKIKVYFNNDKLDPEFSCYKVFPVEREIIKTKATGRAALEELLKGPITSEKEAGFFTNINPGVKIQKLTIENGKAKVDFDKTLEFPGGGSCRVSAIRSQIIQTLKQFSTVKEVVISIDGRIENILQP